MHYVYFIFAGYRVAIGKTSNLLHRIGTHQRLYFKIEVLGVIACDTDKDAHQLERETLKRFQSDNAFRDVFYLSSEMKDWIVENTEPYIPTIHAKHNQEYKRKYEQSSKGKESHRKRQRKYYKNPEVKKYHREYNQRPEVKARHRDAEKKRRAKNRKHRPISPNTLSIPGL